MYALTALKKQAQGYWAERIIAQLQYAHELSSVHGGNHDHLIQSTYEFVQGQFDAEQAITKSTAKEAEARLSVLSAEAKAFQMICVSHAHIDMNWMWRWDETVAITLDTFRTMLDLMEEYSDFTFSQSQASVYRIVEQYAPEMLDEIRARISEGRWEVSASTWVETDKNMPNGESLVRHILYTKQYLAQLLDLEPESLNLDFEPDTFGHSVNVPEILSSGGVKFYYHCRGADGHNLHRWQAPSGRSVLVYREPLWYNATIEPDMVHYVPEFCTKHQMDTMMKVYGVGDHGGGPTRRDIERIRDMNQWPVFPAIRFGTYAEYYSLVEAVQDKLPVVTGEQNFIFTGCYTSQSRIKMANRQGEAALNEAETLNSVASVLAGCRYDPAEYARAWKNVLFNQFHDIIPGSGVIDTREHAMGLFQETLASANSQKALALSAITRRLNTASLSQEEDMSATIAEGAGVGFGVKDFRVSQTSRGAGLTRVFTVFNTDLSSRDEIVEMVVWDWPGDVNRIVVKDETGNVVQHQLLDHGFNQYWGHSYLRFLLKANVAAGGYATYVLTEDQKSPVAHRYPWDPRVEHRPPLVLENECVRAEFDPVSCALVSYIDKSSGQDMIPPDQAGVFRLIQEDPGLGMTSWVVGPYAKVEPLVSNVRLVEPLKTLRALLDPPALRRAFAYTMEFGRSRLTVMVSLDVDSSNLRFDVECDWHEVGKKETTVPQLNFFVPVNYRCDTYKYDVPCGTVVREAQDLDVPGNSWAMGQNLEGQRSLMVVTDSKYGFRGVNNGLGVSLIRSSVDPDPYPEYGIHRMRLGLCVVDAGSSNRELIEQAYRFNHPLTPYSAPIQSGSLPVSGSMLTLKDGTVAISAVKMLESGEPNKVLVRVYETEGKSGMVTLGTGPKVSGAYLTDVNETLLTENDVTVHDDGVTFPVEAYCIANVVLEFVNG